MTAISPRSFRRPSSPRIRGSKPRFARRWRIPAQINRFGDKSSSRDQNSRCRGGRLQLGYYPLGAGSSSGRRQKPGPARDQLRGDTTMRIAAGLIFAGAVSLLRRARHGRRRRRPPRRGRLHPPRRRRRPRSSRRPPAPQPAKAACTNPNALGVGAYGRDRHHRRARVSASNISSSSIS